MGNKLYIDKSCKICTRYASYMKSEESCKMEIEDIGNLENHLRLKDEMIFEANGEYYYGMEAILRSMESSKQSSLATKIVRSIPKVIGKNLYKLISGNRYKISKLLDIIKPKP